MARHAAPKTTVVAPMQMASKGLNFVENEVLIYVQGFSKNTDATSVIALFASSS